MSQFAKGISEIVLIVKDVVASADFYRNVVGLEPRTDANSEWAWFWSGQPNASASLALHRGALLFEEHSPNQQSSRWGQVHYAFEVDLDHLEAAAQHVRSFGIEVYGPTHFEWM